MRLSSICFLFFSAPSSSFILKSFRLRTNLAFTFFHCFKILLPLPLGILLCNSHNSLYTFFDSFAIYLLPYLISIFQVLDAGLLFLISPEAMGSMNSNNWLSFPLSPTQSSLPPQLQATQSHQFSLGLVNDSMENTFQNHGIPLLFSPLELNR